MSAPILTAADMVAEFAAIRRALHPDWDRKGDRVSNSEWRARMYGKDHGAYALTLADQIEAGINTFSESSGLPERSLRILVAEVRKGAEGSM